MHKSRIVPTMLASVFLFAAIGSPSIVGAAVTEVEALACAEGTLTRSGLQGRLPMSAAFKALRRRGRMRRDLWPSAFHLTNRRPAGRQSDVGIATL
jgi:hypothetical protein